MFRTDKTVTIVGITNIGTHMQSKRTNRFQKPLKYQSWKHKIKKRKT